MRVLIEVVKLISFVIIRELASFCHSLPIMIIAIDESQIHYQSCVPSLSD